MNVAECFASIQDESTFAGLPCYFIRLAGCNLRCVYCDTPGAWAGGTEQGIPELAEAFRASGLTLAEITGGEPLLQAGTPDLARALLAAGAAPVLVETNGTCDIGVLPGGTVAVVDVKCPGSGAGASFNPVNLERLRPRDEVKFVLSDRADFDWAAAFVRRHRLLARCGAVLFSPVRDRLPGRDLAAWVLEARLPVRLQPQLHRVLGVA